MIRVLVEAPRWLLLAALLFAPWAYGAMRPWAIRLLSIQLVLITSLWLLECLLRKRKPPLSMPALASALGLLAQGWWMVINAKSIFDPQLMALFPTKPLVEALPGSADGLLSSVTILLTTGLLGVLLFTSDLAQNAVWRRRIWLTMALAGVSMCIFGIVQKIGGPPVLGWVWEESKQDANNNFGMFRYRGNAGAFLNLCLPLVAGLAFRVFQRRQNGWARVFWLSSLLLVLAGVQLNASRLSWLIAILIMSAFGVQVAWHLWKQLDGKLSFRRVAVYALVILFALGALFSISSFGRWATSWAHFKSLAMDPSERSPVEIYIHMVPEAGWLGFGPGTFQVVFPGYQHSYNFGERQAPEFWTTHFWAHAHEDYLEILIEWGYVGTALWGILILGGIYAAVRRLRSTSDFEAGWILFCSILGLIGTLLHAFLDFPLQIASIQLYFCVLLGICWSARRAGPEEQHEKRFRRRIFHVQGGI